LLGNPFETCLAASRLILSGTMDRWPKLKVVLAHGGGFLPYQIGRLDRGWSIRPESRSCLLAPSSYLRNFYYDSLTHSSNALGFLIRLVGAERIGLGTDTPFDMGGPGLASQLSGLALEPAELRAIAFETAASMFGLAEA